MKAYPDPKDGKRRKKIEAERNQWLGERLLGYLMDFCIEIDMTEWESTIERLERYADPYPEDAFDRKARFLSDFVVRTEGEYAEILTRSLKLATGGE